MGWSRQRAREVVAYQTHSSPIVSPQGWPMGFHARIQGTVDLFGLVAAGFRAAALAATARVEPHERATLRSNRVAQKKSRQGSDALDGSGIGGELHAPTRTIEL